jgi:hypothetical protein
LIAFKRHVHNDDEAEKRHHQSMFSMSLQNDTDDVLHKRPVSSLVETTKRKLEEPDFVYKGMLCSDGVVEDGVNIVPRINNISANATNLFKLSLFRVEVK